MVLTVIPMPGSRKRQASMDLDYPSKRQEGPDSMNPTLSDSESTHNTFMDTSIALMCDNPDHSVSTDTSVGTLGYQTAQFFASCCAIALSPLLATSTENGVSSLSE
ncbi:hypothetical protein N7495_001066 [Penicillium taxi]|uniref:uncharacterized protein n=1 Tax=Penicillium taxi TaxID=168475 RepID=UPI002544E29D|nr:uncharacterized protein N7495_001066 [Penicillium taxi]KAJ5908384.1 hypothetical protein N7495_001066 [Penicillium taxi]